MAGLSKENPLKDVFNARVITALSKRIFKTYKKFPAILFENETLKAFPELGFQERSNHLRDTLYKYLPDDYPEAIQILINCMEAEVEPGKTDWDKFYIISLTSFVSKYGKKHYDLSMQALYEFTKGFSAEGDLRTFLEIDYKKTMFILGEWIRDPSPHVRRLVSEGTRPRLPMTGRIKRFQDNPRPVVKLLEKLKGDPELYVRRSVANNINDIAKDNPAIAIATLQKWGKSKSPDVQWVVKHAARSLIKAGHPEIMELLGATPDVKIKVGKIKIDPVQKKYAIGTSIVIKFELKSQSTKTEFLIVDYAIHYQKAHGKISRKVFKLRELSLTPGEIKHIRKKHTFKNTSGRKHYPGQHSIELQINGSKRATCKLYLQD